MNIVKYSWLNVLLIFVPFVSLLFCFLRRRTSADSRTFCLALPHTASAGSCTSRTSRLLFPLRTARISCFVFLRRHQSAIVTFVTAGIAIIPLAALLGFATEDLVRSSSSPFLPLLPETDSPPQALRIGETLGGLLNATFGNAVELIIAILALVKGELDVVQSSMIGSLLSNCLLVLGCGSLLSITLRALLTHRPRRQYVLRRRWIQISRAFVRCSLGSDQHQHAGTRYCRFVSVLSLF